MRCPRCAAGYEDHIALCADCGVPLVADTAPTLGVPARVGRFHPAAAAAVAELARRRGIPIDLEAADGRVDVLVPGEHRDDLRAELLVTWESVLSGIDPETQLDLRAAGGRLAGWVDAPEGAWVDRQGKLRVAASDEEEVAADLRRTYGPALVAAGLLLGLLAWYAGEGRLRLLAAIAGFGLVTIGVFLPR